MMKESPPSTGGILQNERAREPLRASRTRKRARTTRVAGFRFRALFWNGAHCTKSSTTANPGHQVRQLQDNIVQKTMRSTVGHETRYGTLRSGYKNMQFLYSVDSTTR